MSKQACRITITFPVDSDEQAIGIKKKVSEIMAEKPDAQIQFSLMNISSGMTPNVNGSR